MFGGSAFWGDGNAGFIVGMECRFSVLMNHTVIAHSSQLVKIIIQRSKTRVDLQTAKYFYSWKTQISVRKSINLVKQVCIRSVTVKHMWQPRVGFKPLQNTLYMYTTWKTKIFMAVRLIANIRSYRINPSRANSENIKYELWSNNQRYARVMALSGSEGRLFPSIIHGCKFH